MKQPIIISNYDDLKNPYYAGGGAIAVHEVAKRLIKKYTVTVLTGKYTHSHNDIVDGVQYKRVGISFGGPKIGQLVYQFILPYYIRKESFSIWFESFTPPFSTACLQLFTKKPVVGLIHMLSGEDMERKYKLPFRMIENRGLKTYKNFIVLTNTLKKKIKKLNPKANIQVIPNGINPVRFAKKTLQKKYILYLGRIEVNQKGIDLLINAYKQIEKAITYDLVIAGTGESKQIEALQKMVMSYGLTRRVKIIGRVDGKDKDTLLKESVMVVIPSRYETYSLVAMECLAYQIPFITFNIEGLNWIPQGHNIKIAPYNIDLFAQAMYKLATSKNTRSAFIKKNKDIVKNFTWDHISIAYEATIASIMKKNYGTTYSENN